MDGNVLPRASSQPDAKFALGQVVRVADGKFTGTVASIHHAIGRETEYLVKYRYADGKGESEWFQARDIVAM